MCLIGNITLQCEVSAGKQKLTIMLVCGYHGNLVMHKPGSLSSFTREYVNEANEAISLIAM